MDYADASSPLVRHYEADYAALRTPGGDVEFYLEEARRARGACLEFGCGSGRILGPIAEAGIEAWGVDSSEGMLAQARRRLGARATLHLGDMRDIDLGRTFALVTVPFRALSHLLEADDHLRAFRNVRRHLAPGGRLVFDVFQPDPRFTAQPWPEVLQLERAEGAARVRRYASGVPHISRQVSEVRMRWEIEREGGVIDREECLFPMRWFHRFELEHALARAGLRVEAIHGAFDRRPLDDESKEMIFVARRGRGRRDGRASSGA